MISLRKHIESHRDRPPATTDSTQPASGNPSLTALRDALRVMGECSQRAVPSVQNGLSLKLAEIDKELDRPVSPDQLKNASARVRMELSGWAECALRHHNENEREIKEIMDVVARAAEAIGARDQKYAREIGELTGKMRSFAGMKDLAAIRLSILDSTTMLKSFVERMVEDGKASMRHLTTEVEDYRSRLEASEQTASIDPLTHLANRRAFEKDLAARMAAAAAFSVILIDLNDFKSVNDRHGHLAGDDLLRQFAMELRAQFAPPDMVSRWGGDEFAVIIFGGKKEAAERVERINCWVLGEYKVSVGRETVKIMASASVGEVQWDGKETGPEVLARADKGLYRSKGDKAAAAPRSGSRLLAV